jgi:hypothetical protein
MIHTDILLTLAAHPAAFNAMRNGEGNHGAGTKGAIALVAITNTEKSEERYGDGLTGTAALHIMDNLYTALEENGIWNELTFLEQLYSAESLSFNESSSSFSAAGS